MNYNLKLFFCDENFVNITLEMNNCKNEKTIKEIKEEMPKLAQNHINAIKKEYGLNMIFTGFEIELNEEEKDGK